MEDVFSPHMQEFCYGDVKLTPRAYAKQHDLDEEAFVRFAVARNWTKERDNFWKTVNIKVADRQSDIISYEITDRIKQIRDMKDVAFAAALDGNYERLGSGDAVRSYVELEKLERLILDKTTQKFEVDTGKQMVIELLRIIRDEVHDSATRTRIAARVNEMWGAAGVDLSAVDNSPMLRQPN